jgi:hypothetical protein
VTTLAGILLLSEKKLAISFSLANAFLSLHFKFSAFHPGHPFSLHILSMPKWNGERTVKLMGINER